MAVKKKKWGSKEGDKQVTSDTHFSNKPHASETLGETELISEPIFLEDEFSRQPNIQIMTWTLITARSKKQ